MIIPNIWKHKKCSKPPTSLGLNVLKAPGSSSTKHHLSNISSCDSWKPVKLLRESWLSPIQSIISQQGVERTAQSSHEQIPSTIQSRFNAPSSLKPVSLSWIMTATRWCTRPIAKLVRISPRTMIDRWCQWYIYSSWAQNQFITGGFAPFSDRFRRTNSHQLINRSLSWSLRSLGPQNDWRAPGNGVIGSVCFKGKHRKVDFPSIVPVKYIASGATNRFARWCIYPQ